MNVPKVCWDAYTSSTNLTPKGSLIMFGLLPHEHKMSVVNAVLRRTGASEEPIKSKERLLIQCGYRRYVVSPIFSQHTNGKKHKVSCLSIVWSISGLYTYASEWSFPFSVEKSRNGLRCKPLPYFSGLHFSHASWSTGRGMPSKAYVWESLIKPCKLSW